MRALTYLRQGLKELCLSSPMSKMLAAPGWAAPSLFPPPQAPRARTSALRAGLPQPKLGRRQQARGFPRKAIPRPDEGSFSPGGTGNQTAEKSAPRWCKIVEGLLLRWHRVQEKRGH